MEPADPAASDGTRPLLRLLRAVGRPLALAPRPLAWLLVAAWMGLIWSLSAQQIEAGDGSAVWRFVSNMAHAPLFGLLGLFAIPAVARRDGSGPGGRAWPRVEAREVAVVLAVVLAYAIVDEAHQSMTPGRNPSPRDVLTDVTGAACVLAVVALVVSEGASERALRVRLGLGVLACCAAAAIASI